MREAIRCALWGVLAVGVGCEETDPSGGDTDGASDPTGAATSGPLPTPCPGCEGVCLQGECLSAPMPIMTLDPEAKEIRRTEVGISYLISDSLGGASQVFEAPLGGPAEGVFTPPTDQYVTAVHFDGDRLWLAIRYPEAIYVYDRATEELTFLADTQSLLIDILDVRGDTLFGLTYDGVMTMRLDGSGQALVTPAADFSQVQLTDDSIYMLRTTGVRTGNVTVLGLDGANPRELGTYEGFPPRILVGGDRVFWYAGVFQDQGDGMVRSVVDDGSSSHPPATVMFEAGIGTWGVVGDSLVFHESLGSSLQVCPVGGGTPSEAWTFEQANIQYLLPDDPSLVVVEDYDDVVTLYQLPW